MCVFAVGFRILNKLTPEKFDKLSLELLNVGIDSQTVLKGIILLVSVVRMAFEFQRSYITLIVW